MGKEMYEMSHTQHLFWDNQNRYYSFSIWNLAEQLLKHEPHRVWNLYQSNFYGLSEMDFWKKLLVQVGNFHENDPYTDLVQYTFIIYRHLKL